MVDQLYLAVGAVVLGMIIGGAFGYSVSSRNLLSEVKIKETDIVDLKAAVAAKEQELEAVKQEIQAFQNVAQVSER